ncbi:N-acetyltransferase family protein [Aquiflexum sp.]|uniref:GNAT family N-acetyltransferase n=1 Tax=Aquiflexum sp. TaxID=1872584 RepID=UPI00359385BE
MYIIREGKIEDLPRVLELVRELAVYEKAPEQVTNTVQMMEEDGFGPNPVFGFFVAIKESTNEIIGISIYYYRYSTWKGRRLYLEDIVVTEAERGNGAGKILFDRTMLKCLEDGCTGMMWQVLDWNAPAINFYQKYGADLDEGWINCNLQADEIKAILKK